MKKSSKVAAVVLSLGLGTMFLSACDGNHFNSPYDISSQSVDDSSNTTDLSNTDTSNDDSSNSVTDDSSQSDTSVFDTSEQDTTPATAPDPQIGDSEQDVLNSSWGQPDDKTETKDAYGTSAMWFYDGMKSIFFVDGKVNSISQ